MSKNNLIGVDVGVSFIKVGIYDLEGNSKAIITKNNPGKYPKPGVFLQSSEEMIKIVISALKEALEKSGVEGSSVEAIGFSGAMGGLLGVNKNWRPVAEWSIISDIRYYRYVTEMLARAERKIIELSGSSFPVFGPKIMWWRNEFPEIYKNIKKFMGIYSFIIGKLSNIPVEEASIDRTITIFSGIADIKNDCWSKELCDEFGIDMNLLPSIIDSNTVVGKLSKEISAHCGLKEGVPLVAGAGDKPAGSLGAGLVIPGLLIDEAATYGALSLCVDKYIPDIENKTLGNLPSPIKGLYTPFAYLVVSGATSAWFTDVFTSEEKKIADEKGVSVFRILDENAVNIPAGSNGLFAIGMLGGRSNPSDLDIKGLWIGHTLMHKKEHFYKSMLESFAYEYAFYLNVMKKNYPDMKFNEVLVMGGGARSDLYNQIKCDVMGIPYSRLNRDDFALLGDILIAGSAIGIYKDLREVATKFVIKTKKYMPDEKKHSYYKKYVEFYAGLFDKVRNIFVDLKNIS